ncbi:dynamin family protein [Paenibacillus sp.]|uniref:dynamin family protein n=1 Tax=Paenibacillus sp. TaxID=58172 RepID=UPI002812404A|nr:dynamin family protein [Paenibacillus sp.]
MDYRQRILALAEQLEAIGIEHQVPPHIIEQNRAARSEIEEFRILIPLIGTFNAGKSTLLNTYLGRDVLPTDFLPETSIAAELRYGETEEVVAYKKDGTAARYSLDELKSISSRTYSHVQVTLRSDALKRLDNIVLVDMPGLDSSLEEHNQAILSYVRKGVFYLILTEAEYGLKESVLDFLKELNIYDMDCAVLISKTDQKLPEDIRAIARQAAETASNVTGFEVQVGQVSSKRGDLADFTKLLASLEQPSILVDHLEPKAIELAEQVKNDLELRLRHYRLDHSEIDEKMKRLEKSLTQLEKEVELESGRVSKQFGSSTVAEIQEDIRNAMLDNVETLARAAKGGPEPFKRLLNQTLRPVLVHAVESRVTDILSSSYRHISARQAQIADELDLNTIDPSTAETSLLEKVTDTLSSPAFRTLIGGMAILTAVVAPWLELLLFFAPDIIKLFLNTEKRLQQTIETQVIPEVLERLHPNIVRALEDVNAQFRQQLGESLHARQQDIIASLEQAKQDKILAEEEEDQYVFRLEQAIGAVNEVLAAIRKERNSLVAVG